MASIRLDIRLERLAVIAAAASLSVALSSCGVGTSVPDRQAQPSVGSTEQSGSTTSVTGSSRPAAPARASLAALPKPTELPSFGRRVGTEGVWRAAGRRVDGVPAIFQTTLIPPGGSRPAGIAWLDTHLLAARLYSGSASPGGGPYRYTAPIRRASARSLVAAFNGGFLMKDAQGGYYTEGRMIDPLRTGAASLVIYADGSVNVGAWGTSVRMTRGVVAVRQNLVPLVAGGRPTAQAVGPDWQAWGNTCGASSCAHSVPGVEHQWRSGIGVTASGALVYAQGASLAPRQLAALLVRAGVVRAMELDINPDWPIFATYDPALVNGVATPGNGHALTATVRGPDTFFGAPWARDFVTMSARQP